MRQPCWAWPVCCQGKIRLRQAATSFFDHFQKLLIPEARQLYEEVACWNAVVGILSKSKSASKTTATRFARLRLQSERF